MGTLCYVINIVFSFKCLILYSLLTADTSIIAYLSPYPIHTHIPSHTHTSTHTYLHTHIAPHTRIHSHVHRGSRKEEEAQQQERLRCQVPQ